MVRSQHNRGGGRAAGSSVGFTTAELLVASSIVAIAMVGIYGLFSHLMRVEGAAAVRSSGRGSAEAVAELISDSLEQAASAGSMPALVAQTSGPEGILIVQLPDERRRYVWSSQKDPSHICMTLQRKPFAGSTDLEINAPPDEAAGQNAEQWAQIPPVQIASDLARVQLGMRPAREQNAPWVDKWSGAAAGLLVHVVVQAGDEVATRIIAPRATGQGQGEGS